MIRRNDTDYDGNPLPDLTDEQLAATSYPGWPGPIAILPDGTKIAMLAPPSGGMQYPIVEGDIDLTNPLGPPGTPTEQLMAAVRKENCKENRDSGS